MGRLFWKFFALIWLAQLVGIVTIGTTFWLAERHADYARGIISSGPALTAQIGVATASMRYGGVEGFKDWARHDRQQNVFAVDSSGKDVVGRPVAADLVARARQFHADDPRSPVVTDVTDASGHRYLIVASAPQVDGLRMALGGNPLAVPDSALGPPPARGVGPPGSNMQHLPPLIPTLGTFLASAATAFVLAWRVAKPIRTLRMACNAAAGGNLSLRVAPLIGARHDELADLGQDFDRMAQRLQAAMEAQRRLLHDVSHEVRSPLARLQAAVGLLRQRDRQENPTVERIEEEIVRIDKLVGDLLKLSRIESGEIAGQEEQIDLRELMSEIITDCNFEARALGRSIAWLDNGSGTLRGQPDLLRMAIENVVRNALKHAPLSRQIHVETSVDATGGKYQARVLDTGPGVAREELAVLFTPFFRSNRAAPTDGYGLGLAIARRSVETHGGRVWAENRPEGGLAVIITLPLLRAAAPPTPSLAAAPRLAARQSSPDRRPAIT